MSFYSTFQVQAHSIIKLPSPPRKIHPSRHPSVVRQVCLPSPHKTASSPSGIDDLQEPPLPHLVQANSKR